MDVLHLVILLAVGLLLFAAACTLLTHRTLTHPPRRNAAWALARSRPVDPSGLRNAQGQERSYESWTLDSRGLRLPAWEIEGDEPGGPLVVVTPGWGDSRVTMLGRVGVLAGWCSRVIVWDLPGHGEAPGTCTLGTHETEDLLALLRVIEGRGVPIVLFGYSLGGGVSIAAATAVGDKVVRGVIAEAPYRFAVTPARNVLRGAGMPHGVTLQAAMKLAGAAFGQPGGWHREGAAGFDRARLASRVTCRLLVVHGAEDSVSPIEDGRAIAAAAPHGVLLEIEHGGHVDLWENAATAPAVHRGVAAFVRSVTSRALPADK